MRQSGVEMVNPPPPDPGEAPSELYEARDGNGVVANPNEVIFPIIKQLDSGEFALIGTGFFITDNGIFATAKHVSLDVLDRDGNQCFPIGFMQFLPDNKYILRRILRCTSNTIADVAVGVAEPMLDPHTGSPIKNRVVPLSVVPPRIGAEVFTYAYPKTVTRLAPNPQLHFFPRFYDGRLEEFYPSGRDKVLMPAPCYRTSMTLYGGASGGPVIGPDGTVFGINSTGIDGSELPVSFVSRVNELLPLAIDNVLLPGSSEPSSVKVLELAQRGFVIFKPQLDAMIQQERL
jgi:hypothetical protein